MLNHAQSTFCAAPPRQPIRLLAPAGCGKTQSLLWRCRELHARGEGSRFLLIAFTRAACEALRERVRDDPSLAKVSPALTITTLNAWGYRRLQGQQQNLRLLTKPADRTFAVQNQLGSVLEEHPRINAQLKGAQRVRLSGLLLESFDTLKSLGFRHDRTTAKSFNQHLDFLQSCELDSHLSVLVNQLEDAGFLTEAHTACLFDEFMPFFSEAAAELFKQRVITYDDQKYWASIELQQQLARRSLWQGAARYDHLIVDEFQDINPLDLALLRGLSDINQTPLTLVGDDDQAIYEWRAASADFILEPERFLEPERLHEGTYETVLLDTNYRSPRNIVELSQRLIRHNKRRVDKRVTAATDENAEIEPLIVHNLSVAIDTVLEFIRAHPEYQSIALISRKRGQIIPYQVAFTSHDIPFYAAEDLHVFLSSAFESVLNVLSIHQRQAIDTRRLGLSPVKDLLELCDLVSTYPIKKANRDKLLTHLQAARPATTREAVHVLSSYNGELHGKNQGAGEAQRAATSLLHFLDAKTVAKTLSAMSAVFSGLDKNYFRAKDEIFYADPPFSHLTEFAQRYDEDFAAFTGDLEHAIATLAQTPRDEDDTPLAPKPVVHLMTALRAKGKEFDAVIVLDANQDIWPARLARTERQLEAERRLFYVAVTRARKHLLILTNGTIHGEAVAPTPYLEEMGLSLESEPEPEGDAHALPG